MGKQEVFRQRPWLGLVCLVSAAPFVFAPWYVTGSGVVPVVIRWSTFVFGSIGVLVGLLMAIPGTLRLRLDEDGFAMQFLFVENRVGWRDVNHVEVDRLLGLRWVAFDYDPGYEGRRKSRARGREIWGHEGGIPGLFGIPTDRLAARLEVWRIAHGGGE